MDKLFFSSESVVRTTLKTIKSKIIVFVYFENVMPILISKRFYFSVLIFFNRFHLIQLPLNLKLDWRYGLWYYNVRVVIDKILSRL